jgi:hypothetical protein
MLPPTLRGERAEGYSPTTYSLISTPYSYTSNSCNQLPSHSSDHTVV